MRLLRQGIGWLRRHLPEAILGTVVGCVVSALLVYVWPDKPRSLETIHQQALVYLLHGNFDQAVNEFAVAVGIDPKSTTLWEGKAYAHLGREYKGALDLNAFCRCQSLEHRDGGTDMAQALDCARRALFNATTPEERVRSNLVLGFVLHLTGLDDWGARKHHLAPLEYYAEAARLKNQLIGGSWPNTAIAWTSYSEAVDCALESRLLRYTEEDMASLISAYFPSGELRARYTARVKYLRGTER